MKDNDSGLDILHVYCLIEQEYLGEKLIYFLSSFRAR